MKYFVTGATGYIGEQIVKKIVQRGDEVHALFRSVKKAENLPKEGVYLFEGDLRDTPSLERAVKGCDAVFHIAAYAKPWARDSRTYYQLNVTGALNVFRAALNAGAHKVVFTSTAGVISPSQRGRPSDEDTPRHLDYFTHYERSKAEAEREALALASKEALHISIVNPTRVYGPGLLSDSNGVTRMVKLYLEGKFKLLPGDGSSIGNYVYIDDVVEGHLKAMDKGRPGERYILGGDNASFTEFFKHLSQINGREQPLFRVPIWAMKWAAQLMEWRANLTGKEPLLTPPWVKKYLHHWELTSEKAETELGYLPTPLPEGLKQTVDWLQIFSGK